MKITIERERLAAAFNVVATVAPARSPKEILRNVKLIADGLHVALVATDMGVGIRVVIREGVDVVTPGSVLLPVQRFGAIVRENSDEILTLFSDENAVRVQGSRSKFSLPYANPDQFPSVPEVDDEIYHKLEAGTFRKLLSRTSFATDTDSSRYALGGVLFEMDGESVIAVGTDGRRLACMESKGESFGGHRTNGLTAIVPVNAIRTIERALAAYPSEVHFQARLNDAVVRFGDCTITARLVEGRYPNWRQVIPNRDPNKAEIVAGVMLSVTNQAAIVTDNESRGVDVTIGENEIIISAKTSEIGESRVTSPIAYGGDSITITLDSRFVRDFVKVLPAEDSFDLDLADSSSPAIFTTDDGYTYVLMPMARDA